MWLSSVARSCATRDESNKDNVRKPTILAGINRPPPYETISHVTRVPNYKTTASVLLPRQKSWSWARFDLSCAKKVSSRENYATTQFENVLRSDVCPIAQWPGEHVREFLHNHHDILHNKTYYMGCDERRSVVSLMVRWDVKHSYYEISSTSQQARLLLLPLCTREAC